MADRHLRSRKVVDYKKLQNGIGLFGEAAEISDLPHLASQLRTTPLTKKDSITKSIDILDASISEELDALTKEEDMLKKQIALLGKRKAVEELRALSLSQTHSQSQCETQPKAKHPQSIMIDSELEAAMNVLNSCQLQDVLEPTDLKYSHGTIQHPKSVNDQAYPDIIPDFVTKPNTCTVRGSNNKDMVRKVEDVTTEQWISANAKILIKLIDEGMDMEGVKSYLRYTVNIGNYLQVSKPPSVMLLDNEHRHQVYEEHKQWQQIDGEKMYFYLKPLPEKGEKQDHRSEPVPRDAYGKTLCLRYNRPSGCQLTFCKFSHVCLVCQGPHSKMQHQEANQTSNSQGGPPRFRHP